MTTGIMFRPELWQGKLKAMESLGYAVTRRLSGLDEVNKEPDRWHYTYKHHASGGYEYTNGLRYLLQKPRDRVGQVVYVREAWATEAQYDHLAPRNIPQTATIHYMSDGVGEWPLQLQIGKWRSPMFMPAWVARYFIRILEVRPERLNQITEEDAIAEGCRAGIVFPNKWPDNKGSARDDYAALWDVINPKDKWASAPFVWRYKLELAEKPK